MPRSGARLLRVAAIAGALVLIGLILWIDVTTAVWQEVVILSGLAAGLVTFLLTVLVLDKVIARSTARRWDPVNRLALTEFLHAIADDDRSEISRGHIVARALPGIDRTEALHPQLVDLRERILEERALLSDVLSRWTDFLASSGDNEEVLRHVAGVALHLDRARDAALVAELDASPENLTALEREITDCNGFFTALEEELRSRLEVDRSPRLRRPGSHGSPGSSGTPQRPAVA
jgi:hypothetical protein